MAYNEPSIAVRCGIESTKVKLKTKVNMENTFENMQLSRNDGNTMLAEVLPKWMDGCPLVAGWCRYNGRIFFADLNYEESDKAQKPIFDLAYCATKALNGIYLLRREWDSKKFCRWGKHSNW